jgi:flagellar motor switch protein FliN/FliY
MADKFDQIGQDEIEQLLKQTSAGKPAGTPPASPSSTPAGNAALGMNEIESLLQSAATGQASTDSPIGGPATRSAGESAAKRPGPSAGRAAAGLESRGASSEGGPASGDIEFLLRQAEEALASVNNPVNPMPPLPVAPFKLQDFTGAPASTDAATLDLIRDVELNLKIELGRTHMYLEDVLKLRKGSVVPLDKLAGDPVDIYVNGRLIARGEVLVLNDNFAVRVAELVAAGNAA